MKAIQVKYIGATDTKPSRLKAWTEAGELVECVTYDCHNQAHELAKRYAREIFGLNAITGFGSLPNGDWVATIGGAV